jgi:hypothetical protein
MIFETSVNPAGRWLWTLCDPHQGVIATSGRSYRTLLECVAAIERVRAARQAAIFIRGERAFRHARVCRRVRGRGRCCARRFGRAPK